MRGGLGLLGLVLAALVVGIAAKRALSPSAPPVSPGGAPSVAPDGTPPLTPRQQMEQVRRAAEAAMQAPRPMPDDR